jgi:hypothetical protein
MAFFGFIGLDKYRCWSRVEQIAVPDLVSVFRQFNSLGFLRSGLIE